MLHSFNSNGWIHPLPLMRSLVLMKLVKDLDFNIIKDEYLERIIIPANPDAHRLEMDAVKELIDYLK